MVQEVAAICPICKRPYSQSLLTLHRKTKTSAESCATSGLARQPKRKRCYLCQTCGQEKSSSPLLSEEGKVWTVLPRSSILINCAVQFKYPPPIFCCFFICVVHVICNHKQDFSFQESQLLQNLFQGSTPVPIATDARKQISFSKIKPKLLHLTCHEA